jgi:hypothetical protein
MRDIIKRNQYYNVASSTNVLQSEQVRGRETACGGFSQVNRNRRSAVQALLVVCALRLYQCVLGHAFDWISISLLIKNSSRIILQSYGYLAATTCCSSSTPSVEIVVSCNQHQQLCVQQQARVRCFFTKHDSRGSAKVLLPTHAWQHKDTNAGCREKHASDAQLLL